MGSSHPVQGPSVRFVLFVLKTIHAGLGKAAPVKVSMRKRQGLGLPVRDGVKAWSPLQGRGWGRVVESRKGLEAAPGSWGRANPGPECYEPAGGRHLEHKDQTLPCDPEALGALRFAEKTCEGTCRGGWG